MNNDGSLDLLFTNFGGASDLFVNNGDGTFTGGTSSTYPFLGEYNKSIASAFADVDNDGDLDLLVVSGDDELVNPNGMCTCIGNSGVTLPLPTSCSATLCSVDTDVRHRLYINNGGTFVQAAQFGSQASSSPWCDLSTGEGCGMARDVDFGDVIAGRIKPAMCRICE